MANATASMPSTGPYRDPSINRLYELLFGDRPDLYQKLMHGSQGYPWESLLSETAPVADLQQIATDDELETRAKLLACFRLRAGGHPVPKRELLAVVIEVGLDKGLDVLASYQDGTARYINQSEKIAIWETTDSRSNLLTSNLFRDSIAIVSKIGPWAGPRRPFPTRGNLRISFLLSDGLYFGEGPMNALFNDPLAAPALNAAVQLMQYITDRVLKTQ
ncbi:hypothetical protein ACO2Q8_02005 [Larkinella sp. VNQ87]|uniref:hypothetical protein n=1 Tax=Larkinella sp. VNQ87 TaxID=3400921 RepID=UPI003C0EC2E0